MGNLPIALPPVGWVQPTHRGRVGCTHPTGCWVGHRVSPSAETLRKYAAAVGKRLRVVMV